MTSYYCPKCKAEFDLGVDCNCKSAQPHYDMEAFDAALRISNIYTLFAELPSHTRMAEIITTCYGPTLLKLRQERDHIQLEDASRL